MKTRFALTLLLFATIARADELANRIEAMTKNVEAVVGVSAEDTLTGRTLSVHGGEVFPMAGVEAFPIALAVLHRETAGVSLDLKVTVEPADFAPGHSPMIAGAGANSVTVPLGTLLVYGLRDGDTTASDALLRVLGGYRGAMTYLNYLSMRGIDIHRSQKEIATDLARDGEKAYWSDAHDAATPDAMRLLFRMYDQKAHGLDAGGQQFIRDMLAHSEGGEGGIRAGAPSDSVVLERSGTGPGVANDTGIVATSDQQHRIIVVVFTKGWTKTPEAQREKLIADITRAIVGDFSKTRM